MKDLLKFAFVTVLSLLAGAYLAKCQSPQGAYESDKPEIDTVKGYDTIPYHNPAPQSELKSGTQRVRIPKSNIYDTEAGDEFQCSSAGNSVCPDSIGPNATYGTGAGGEPRCSNDSALVELPVIQRHYSDSTYEAWVSGPVDPRLDSLNIYGATTVITKREWKPPKRWHIGISAGYGYGPNGFQPYVGIGITYSIFSF